MKDQNQNKMSANQKKGLCVDHGGGPWQSPMFSSGLPWAEEEEDVITSHLESEFTKIYKTHKVTIKMTSADNQDPLASTSYWEYTVKIEPEFSDFRSYLDESGQADGNREQAQGHFLSTNNVAPNEKDSDYNPSAKPKRQKKKYKNKKPAKPWVSNKLYPCSQCDYVANRYNNLTAHMGKHSDIKNLFCDFCPYSTRYKTSLRRHVKYQHVLNDAVEDCPWCDFKTSFKCNLKTHIQRLHSCTECQYKGTEDEIMSHFNETHAGEKEAIARYLQKQTKKVAERLSYLVNDNANIKTEENSDGSENDIRSDNDIGSENDIRSDNDISSDKSKVKADDDDIDDNIFVPECEIMEISNVPQGDGEGDEVKNELNGTVSENTTNEFTMNTSLKTPKKKAPIEENKFSCSECEFTTRKCDNFVKHMQISHDATFEIDNSYKCRHCDYSSRFKHNLRLHETKHTGEKIYKCTLCDYGTSYNTVFQRHQRKHEQKLLGPFFCDKCTFKTNTQGRLQYHMQRSHQIVNDTAHKCDYCDFYTDVKWRLNKHVNKSQNDGEIICQYCDFKSQFKCQMRMHKKEHLWSLCGSDKVKPLRKSARLSGFVADEQSQETVKDPLADVCGQVADICRQVAENCVQTGESCVQTAVNSQMDGNIDPIYNSSRQMDNSMDTNDELSKCDELTDSLRQLDNNVQLLSSIGGLADTSNQDQVSTYDPTVENFGPQTINDGQPTLNNREATVMDETNQFSDESNYSEHYDPSEYQSTSMPNDQYDINQQNDIAMSDNLFSYNSIEEQNNSLKNSFIIDDGAIKLNEVRVGYDRTRDKPYSCFQCVYTAKYKAAVQRHYLRHHSTQMKPYKCKYCGFQTTTRDAMWKHTKRSLILEVVNCECNEFSSRYRCELLQHKKSHNHFQCDLCSQSYKSRYDFERHILNHSTPNSVFQCQMCSYTTDKEYHLLEHEVFHNGTKPFKCDVCSYSTVKELLLNLHRRKWHGHLCRTQKVDGDNDKISDDNDKISGDNDKSGFSNDSVVSNGDHEEEASDIPQDGLLT